MSDNRKSSILLTAIIFAVTLTALAVPTAMFVFGDAATFSSSATVGNAGPSVAMEAHGAITLTAATATDATFYFVATDTNSWGDLNDSSAQIVINKTGETSRSNTSCSATSHPSNTQTRYTCIVTFQYYDGSGAWSINASVKDNSGVYAQDVSQTVTINSLDAISRSQASISFSGAPGASDIAASPNPQVITNNGNVNFNTINVKGYNFKSGANTIVVGNVSMNTADSAAGGNLLTNNTNVALTSGVLNKGAGSTEQIYFFLDIPASMPAGTYSAESDWTITASST